MLYNVWLHKFYSQPFSTVCEVSYKDIKVWRGQEYEVIMLMVCEETDNVQK
jgi:hypothetical protein